MSSPIVAIHNFRSYLEERGVKFVTYAQYWARFRVQEYLDRNRLAVNQSQSRSLRRIRRSLFKTIHELEQELGRDATPGDVAQRLDVDEQEVRRCWADMTRGRVPMEGPHGEPTLADRTPSPEELCARIAEARRARDLVRLALDSLPQRERKIVEMRRLEDERPSLREVGEELGVSGERVRQLEARALRRMQEAIEASRKKMAAQRAA